MPSAVVQVSGGSSGRLSPGFFEVTIKSQAAEAEVTSHQNRTR